MHLIDDEQAVIAGRMWNKNGPKTALWLLAFTDKIIETRLGSAFGRRQQLPGYHKQKRPVTGSVTTPVINRIKAVFTWPVFSL